MPVLAVPSVRIYQTTHIPKGIQKKLQNEKILKIALSILTLGLYYVAVLILDKIQAKWINHGFMPASFNPKSAVPHPDRIQIETFDHVRLDAREILCKKKTDKWITFFCPNGALYEDVQEQYVDLARRVKANILFFNYRGCGHSGGKVKPATELLLDGSAVVEHLKAKDVPLKNILLYGHSIGGGVAATVAEHYKGIKIINDRSFKAVSDVVSSFATRIIGPIVKITRYEINAFKSWLTIPDENKGVVYHPEDGIVGNKRVGLYNSVKKLIKKEHPERCDSRLGLADQHKPARVKLKEESKMPPGLTRQQKFRYGQMAHCRAPYENERKEIVKLAKRLLAN